MTKKILLTIFILTGILFACDNIDHKTDLNISEINLLENTYDSNSLEQDARVLTKKNNILNPMAQGVGVNFNRYRVATYGCYQTLPGHGGFWNENCKAVSAENAVSQLTNMGLKKVKLFAPGSFPRNEHKWTFDLWKEDIQALAKSGQAFELFIGIPNNSVFEVAGFDFQMKCGSDTFKYPEQVMGSTSCGSSAEERKEALQVYLLEKVQSYIGSDIFIECSETGATYAKGLDAYKSRDIGKCTQEEITSVMSDALANSYKFMENTDAAEQWLNENVFDLIDNYNTKLKISFIGVANEPFASWNNNIYDMIILAALKKTQIFIDKNQDIHSSLSNAVVTVPIAGTYRDKIIHVGQVLEYLEEIQSIFMQNIYPHYETFKQSIDRVLLKQKELNNSFPKNDDGIYEKVYISYEDVDFIEDFLNWSIGKEVSSDFLQGRADTFYEEFITGYYNSLKNDFNRPINIPVVAGETGWPSENDRIYLKKDNNTFFKVENITLMEVSRHTRKTINGKSYHEVPFENFRQMLSNQFFNIENTASYAHSTAAYLRESGQGGYFFELLDEKFKLNEAQVDVHTDYQLEPHYGLLEVIVTNTKPAISKVRKKFDLDFHPEHRRRTTENVNIINHNISLRSYHGKYLVAENNGTANANRTKIGAWEKWDMNLINFNTSDIRYGDTVSLRATHGKYLVAENSGAVTAKGTQLSPLGEWTLVRPGKGNPTAPIVCGSMVGLRSIHGKYLVAESNDRVNADRNNLQAWETFTINCHASISKPHVQLMDKSNTPMLPQGWKAICMEGPDTSHHSPTCEVLVHNNTSYWALSHNDNRFGIAIAAYNEKREFIGILEKSRTRNIWNIDVNEAGDEVTFYGEANSKVIIPFDQLDKLIKENLFSYVKIFQHKNYRGNSKLFTIGRYNIDQLGIINDELSSVIVPPGMKITLYKDADFKGKHRTYLGNKSFVGLIFNDKTSSLIVEYSNTVKYIKEKN